MSKERSPLDKALDELREVTRLAEAELARRQSGGSNLSEQLQAAGDVDVARRNFQTLDKVLGGKAAETAFVDHMENLIDRRGASDTALFHA